MACALSCIWLCNTMDYSLPGSLSMGFTSKKTGVVCHFLLARFKLTSPPFRRQIFYHWATREAHWNRYFLLYLWKEVIGIRNLRLSLLSQISLYHGALYLPGAPGNLEFSASFSPSTLGASILFWHASRSLFLLTSHSAAVLFVFSYFPLPNHGPFLLGFVF